MYFLRIYLSKGQVRLMTYLSTDQNHLPGASGHHFCCTLHVHVMYIKMNYTQYHFGPRYQGHSRFSKNYPPCPSLTAISCLYTIIMMFLKGMFINISSCRMPTRSFGRKELHVSPYSDFVTTVFCVPNT